ncbi:MAG: hypothetical protein NTZ80_00225 [Patescibacteria group bacterium]|nr:hypothetical protein [Patescibacteria group bacterium]
MTVKTAINHDTKPRKKKKLNPKMAITALALGSTKEEAATLAGSKAKSASARIHSLDRMLNREDTKRVISKMCQQAAEMCQETMGIAEDFLADSSLDNKTKLKIISPLASVRMLEVIHKIYRLENNQSTDNIMNQYQDYSPQQIRQRILEIAKEQGIICT